jgi:TonB family protein
MTQQLRIRRRSGAGSHGRSHARRPVRAAFERPAHGGALAARYPGFSTPDDEGRKRRFLTGGIAAAVHFGALGLLVFFASLSPVVQEQLIPVQILREEPEPPPPPPEPAAAPKALAERRPLPFAPAVQAVAPQIVNPHVIAEASPAIEAEALQMDAVDSAAAPTQISRSATVVERVSAVSSVARAQAAAVDVANVGAPVVRGPTRVDAPVGPSVGPRQVTAAAVSPTVGTAMKIGGNGSSVAEGVVSSRDVVGSPDGALVVAVDTAIGDGLLRGAGGGSGTSVVSQKACVKRPEVQRYVADVKTRMLERWVLPPGVDPDMEVQLRFRLDAAGSASNIAIVRTGDNALGASAVDALRAASPFPPMPDEVRCLTHTELIGTFSNPDAG